jgi:PIN domain nuclease of toxin-antitoxin system
MNLLLDSHVAIWMLYDKSHLSRAAVEALEDERNELKVSYATLWELTMKIQRGGLPILGSSVLYLMQELPSIDVSLLRIRRQHILAVEELPYFHRDPFDRMLIAQAAVEGMTLVTADAAMKQYNVPLLW